MIKDGGATWNSAHFHPDSRYPPLPSSSDSCPKSDQLVEEGSSQMPTFYQMIPHCDLWYEALSVHVFNTRILLGGYFMIFMDERSKASGT